MKEINISWSALEPKIKAKGLRLRYSEINNVYAIGVSDNPTIYHTAIPKSQIEGYDETQRTADQTDFEQNYKDDADKYGHEVVIREESTRTGGNFQILDLKCDIPAGAAGDWTEYDFTWPLPVSLLSASWPALSENDGDEAEVSVAKDTVIGSLSVDEAIGETTLSVGSTVIDNLVEGYWVTISDGVNTQDLGRCLDIDTSAGTIKVETATTDAYLSATPTYIKMTNRLCPWKFLKGTGFMVSVGETKIGGSYLPANKILSIRYRNNNGVAKKFTITAEYLY